MRPRRFAISWPPDADTNPPVVNLHWPNNGTRIGQNQITCRGLVDNPATTIKVSSLGPNGLNQTFDGIVERDGSFWVEDIPMQPGSNSLKLEASGPGTRQTVTNIMVVRADLDIAIKPLSPSDTSAIGVISHPGYTLWVNGVKARETTGGDWQADLVPPLRSHSDVDYVTSDGAKHVRRIADTQIGLSTGGKAIAGRKNLFCLSASATAISDEDMPTPTSTPVESGQIRIGTMGKLGSDGKLWIVLPDGLP